MFFPTIKTFINNLVLFILYQIDIIHLASIKIIFTVVCIKIGIIIIYKMNIFTLIAYI